MTRPLGILAALAILAVAALLAGCGESCTALCGKNGVHLSTASVCLCHAPAHDSQVPSRAPQASQSGDAEGR